jgi:AcrR family transcriptional regulator
VFAVGRGRCHLEKQPDQTRCLRALCAATAARSIAERADTARRTLFNHFPRKRDILDIWTDRRRDRLVTLFDDEAPANVSARERLTRQFDALATIDTDDPALAKVIVVGMLTEMGAMEESFSIFDAFRETVALGQERGEFSDRAWPGLPLAIPIIHV